MGKGEKKLRPELAGSPAGCLPGSPAALTFLRGILGGGGGSEVGWSPAPPVREAAVAAVLALAGSVVTAVSPVLRHVCSGGASPLPPPPVPVPCSVPHASAGTRSTPPLRHVTPEPASQPAGAAILDSDRYPGGAADGEAAGGHLGFGLRAFGRAGAAAAILGPGLKSACSRRCPGTGAGVFPREPCWVRAALSPPRWGHLGAGQRRGAGSTE